jgi:hypothetical protein
MAASRSVGTITVFFALSVAVLGWSALRHPAVNTALAGPSQPAEVHGFVATQLQAASFTALTRPVHIRLPRVTVFLQDTTTSVARPPVLTNVHGWYMMPPAPPGRYHICVRATGFVSRCDPAVVTLAGETFSTRTDTLIFPQKPGAIRGRVALKDTSPCYHENVYFRSHVEAVVALRDSHGKTGLPVVANDTGTYVLPVGTGRGSYTLIARCAAGTVQLAVTLTASDLSSVRAVDLTTTNAAPRLTGIVPRVGTTAVRAAATGSVMNVKATAVSPTGNALHYRWGDGTSSFRSVDAPQTSWKLPSSGAANFLFVEVTDGKGGYADGYVKVPTGDRRAAFTGTVTEAPGMGVAGASVTIGESSTRTDDAGRFFLRVAEAGRYVVNAQKPGYALTSRVFTTGEGSLELRLHKASRITIDASKGALVRIIGRGNDAPSTVTIPPGALVDAKGNRFMGTAAVDTFAYDLNETDPIPGDWGAKDAAGHYGRMEPYGTVHIGVSDAQGQPLELSSEASAPISIAISPDRLKTAPATIPLLTYDTTQGIWLQQGQLTRDGARYVGTVRHFSQFNADTVFTNTACIRLNVADNPPLLAPSLPFILHVSYPSSTLVVNHNNFLVTDPSNNILYRLPPNTNVTLEIHPASGPDWIMRSFTVNSGAPISNAFNGIPPLPYDACNGFDPASTPQQPVLLAVALPAHSMPYLTINGAGSQAEAAAYYDANAGVTVNPSTFACSGGPKCTFAGWKTANSFNGTEPAVAYYYNGGDLGLGREMHCRQNGADLACYVTNYGAPGGDSDTAVSDAINHTSPGASVAMEYSAAGGSAGVRFFVFAPGTGTLATQAVLDSEGPKNVPHLCIQCHGGSYQTNNTITGSSFLPFDVYSYKDNAAAGVTIGGQQAQFQLLNQLVAGTNPNPTNPNNPLVALANGLIPGLPAASTFVPPNWAGHESLYGTVTAVSCRTCHVAQNSGIDWTAYTQFANDFSGLPPGYKSAIQTAVCTAGAHYMPHAEVTYKKFWLSTNPSSPAYLADTSTGINFSGGCPP